MNLPPRGSWPLPLLTVVACAYLSARTANGVLAATLVVEPRPAASQKESPTRHAPSPVSSGSIGRLLGFADREAIGAAETPNRAPLPLQLLGTIVASQPTWSIATLRELETGRTRVVAVGDEILGARVTEIRRWRVAVLRDGQIEVIAPTEAGGGEAPGALKSAESPVRGRPWPAIRSSGPNAYDLPRTALDWMLSHLAELAMQVRVIPSIRGGESIGFTVMGIRGDSVLRDLGITDGDVIRRVNGYALTSPEKILELYTQLLSGNRFEVELERGGVSLRKTYAISG